MKLSIYEFKDYKEYLRQILESLGKGAKAHLALAANCQAAYVTHVLGGSADFSLEKWS